MNGSTRPNLSRERHTGVATPTDVDEAETYDQLSQLLEDLEATEWREIPGFSVAEAAALTSRLEESRAKIEQRREGSA